MARTSALALLVSFAFTACSGGGGGSHVTPTAAQQPTGTATNAPSSSSTKLAYGAKLLSGAKLSGKVTMGTVRFTALVRPQNAAGLVAYAAAANTPGSGSYRQFLSSTQIGTRYGASASDYQAAATYFRSFGLKVAGWPQRLTLSVAGTQANVEKALNTSFGLYTASGGKLIGPSVAPSVPASVPLIGVSLVKDLRKFNTPYRADVPVGGGQGNNYALGYTPQQIASAFDFTGAYSAGYTGAGIKLGIIGTGPFDPDDITAYEGQFGWPQTILGRAGTGGVTQVDVTSSAAALAQPIGDGSPTATPPPVTSPACENSAPPANELPACNPEDAEAQIDTESALLAPDANVLFYLAYVPDECGSPSVSNCAPDPTTGYGYAYIGIDESDDEIEQAIADNNGGDSGADVLSLSYGQSEESAAPYYFEDNNGNYSTDTFGIMEYAALSAEGVAVFISSGDAGAQGCARPAVPGDTDDKCVSWPAVDPDVVSVGGVTTPLSAAGRFI
ncbi:MAG: protease pro-enzyme activation domain-containing protein, partial [Vulcanimicrobiaceae bacterium]